MTDASVTANEAYGMLRLGRAPEGLVVHGKLDYSAKAKHAPPPEFPPGLSVDVLDLSGCEELHTLPAGLRAYELDLSNSSIEHLPADIQVESRLNLAGCDRLESLPDGLTVGSLNLRGCTALKRLPEGLDVWFLDMSGCWAFEEWPKRARIRGGQLQLRGCTALRSLPADLGRLAAVDVRECPNLRSLPPDLVVTGYLELGHSGLTDEEMLPPGLANTQLRWAGINVDRRIAFHPELIEVGEILSERNAERRRVLMDRFGYSRFLQEANAEKLDSDFDPGGQRQLLRVKLEGDEDLVALSCFCPSTQRQYMIRVPPTTTSCHQAAAWIAGFEDPDDYHPLFET